MPRWVPGERGIWGKCSAKARGRGCGVSAPQVSSASGSEEFWYLCSSGPAQCRQPRPPALGGLPSGSCRYDRGEPFLPCRLRMSRGHVMDERRRFEPVRASRTNPRLAASIHAALPWEAPAGSVWISVASTVSPHCRPGSQTCSLGRCRSTRSACFAGPSRRGGRSISGECATAHWPPCSRCPSPWPRPTCAAACEVSAAWTSPCSRASCSSTAARPTVPRRADPGWR